jgi:hypothetical protein
VAEQAPPPEHGGGGHGGLSAVTRKLGPLPVWAWVGVVVAGYLLYRHFAGGGTASTAASTDATDQTYVPPFDAATSAGSGGIGSTTLPTPGTAPTTGAESTPPMPPTAGAPPRATTPIVTVGSGGGTTSPVTSRSAAGLVPDGKSSLGTPLAIQTTTTGQQYQIGGGGRRPI